MKLLEEVVSGDRLSSGIYPSMAADSAPFWKDGENVIFDDKGVRKNFGLLGLENLGDTPTGIKTTFADNEARAFIGGGQNAYRYRTSDGLTQIASFAAAAGQFQFLPWDTWCLINNTTDPLKLWKNAGLAAVVGSMPFTRANVIFGKGIKAFAGGTDNGGNVVEWCANNDIENWAVTLTGSAGNLPLRDLIGDIIAAKPIGDAIGIYSHVNAGLFVELGGTLGYGFRRPIRGVSALSANSIVSLGDRHFGLTQDNAFVTDLVGFQYIDEPAMRKYVRDNADWSRLSEVYGWPDWANSIVRWAVPKNGGGFFNIGFRFDKGIWTRFNDSVIVGDEAGAFQSMLLAKTDRLLRQNKTGYNNDTVALTSFVQTKPLDFGERNMLKRLQKISIDGEWTGSPQISIAYTGHPNETPIWAFTSNLANEVFPDSQATDCEGELVHIKIQSANSNDNWRLSGLKFYGTFTAVRS